MVQIAIYPTQEPGPGGSDSYIPYTGASTRSKASKRLPISSTGLLLGAWWASLICNFYITVSNCLHRPVLETLCMLSGSATSISQCPIAYTDLSLRHSACSQDLQFLYHSVQLPTQICPSNTLHVARICNFYITVSNCLHRSVLQTLCMLPGSETSISQCPIAYTDLSLKHSAYCQDLQLLYHSVQLPTQICPWDTLHAARICNFYITVSNCLHRSVLKTLCMLPWFDASKKQTILLTSWFVKEFRKLIALSSASVS